MPQRFLRPGIVNSERWNTASWREQSLYIRLLMQVDDYGRCDGRVSVLLGQCFAVWNEKHPEDAIDLKRLEEMLQQLAANCGMIERYEVDGKKVIQVMQWLERVRDGVKERWPANPKPRKVAATCSKLLPSSPSPSLSPSIIHTHSGSISCVRSARARETTPERPVCEDSATELPAGFPRTRAEAIEQGKFVNCPEDLASKAYDKALSRGGRDSQDIPIRNWRGYLATQITYARDQAERDNRNTSHGLPSGPSLIEKELDAAIAAAQKL